MKITIEPTETDRSDYQTVSTHVDDDDIDAWQAADLAAAALKLWGYHPGNVDEIIKSKGDFA